MNRLIATVTQFSFPARELPAKLLEHIQCGETGYWQHQFDRLADREQPFTWNLGIANGKILYSGNRVLSAQMLLRVLGRYVSRTNNYEVKVHFDLIKRKVQEEALNPIQSIAMMKQSGIITETQLIEALRTKILNDLDIYLLMGSGSAKFIAEEIEDRFPVAGFSPIILLDEAQQRQLEWIQVRKHVPSMKLCPILDRDAMAKATLSASQRERIEKMVQSDKTLNSIAEGMAKDNLKVAQMFAKLAKIGLVRFEPHKQHTVTTVMAIDDSPVLLAQFKHWVSALGYTGGNMR
jgi:predicted transcriptional regulator